MGSSPASHLGGQKKPRRAQRPHVPRQRWAGAAGWQQQARSSNRQHRVAAQGHSALGPAPHTQAAAHNRSQPLSRDLQPQGTVLDQTRIYQPAKLTLLSSP